MTLLFIAFTHYSDVVCSTILTRLQRGGAIPDDTLAMSANFNKKEDDIDLALRNACPKMQKLDAEFKQDQTYGETSRGRTPFERLITYAKERYDLSASNIVVYIEGNYTDSAGEKLSKVALELVNFIKPGTVIFFTGTFECRRFIGYWASQKDYPLFQPLCGDDWVDPSEKNFDCYEIRDDLSDEQITAALSVQKDIQSLAFSYTPFPEIAILDKDPKGSRRKPTQSVLIVLQVLRERLLRKPALSSENSRQADSKQAWPENIQKPVDMVENSQTGHKRNNLFSGSCRSTSPTSRSTSPSSPTSQSAEEFISNEAEQPKLGQHQMGLERTFSSS